MKPQLLVPQYKPCPHCSTPVPGRPPGWQLRQINRSFLRSLFARFAFEPFTTQDAYSVYLYSHARIDHLSLRRTAGSSVSEPGRWTETLDYWQQMSARNSLCAAAAWDLVLRTKDKGEFMFASEPQ